jgi:putative ABC transport system permease protein
MDHVAHDVRYALRRFGRERTFAAMAVLTLALGIGANTAILSVVRSVLLAPLPYANAGRLVMVWNPREGDGGTTWLSAQEVQSYQREASALHVASYQATNLNLSGGTEPERLRAAMVTGNLFEVLGVSATIGRVVQPTDDIPGGAPVVLIGHGLWQRAFGGASDIVGRTIQVSGAARTVIGVMPAEFRLPLDYREDRPSELWIPLGLDPANLGGWGDRSYIGIGVLRDGMNAQQATADLARVAQGWIAQGFVADEGDRGLFRHAVPLHEFVTGVVRRPLLVLLGAVGFVLLIACANVANLLLASADRRRRELAVRSALGASRRRIARQLLAEAVVLSLAGGAAGLAVAFAGTRALIALDPSAIPRVENVALDATTLAATALLAILTGLLFGVAPALQLSRADVAGMLKDGGRGTTLGPERHHFRNGLVVLEMALSLLLLAGAGLLLRSFVELRRIDLGFDPSRVLTLRLALPVSEYPDTTSVTTFYRQLVGRVSEIPGVESAAAVRVLPLAGTIGDWSITLEGRPRVPGENPNGDWQVVTPGYFATMRIPLVRGRFFTEADMASGALSVVVSEAMANTYWPNEDAVGQRFHLGTQNQRWMTVVGVAGQVRHNALVEEPRSEMYLPHGQMPAEVGFAPYSMALVIRTTADPMAIVPAVRQAVRTMNPGLPLGDVRSMEAIVADALSGSRFTTLLLAIFAGVAVLLAAIGIYGTISLLVSQRAHELGVRLALGAGRRTILAMVLRRGMILTGIGAAAGLFAAFLLTSLLESLVYGVGTLDSMTFATVPLVLGVVAFMACLAPAIRAARLDPVVTLRQD